MTVQITFDGAALTGRRGQSIGGILLVNGHRTWRDARGCARGIFCGIGVCQECVVTVNGVEGVRACQRTACDGDDVTREART